MGGTPVSFDAAQTGGTSKTIADGQSLQRACLEVNEPSKDGTLSAPGALMFKLDFQLMAELKALMLQEKGTAMTTVEGGIVMIN